MSHRKRNEIGYQRVIETYNGNCTKTAEILGCTKQFVSITMIRHRAGLIKQPPVPVAYQDRGCEKFDKCTECPYPISECPHQND